MIVFNQWLAVGMLYALSENTHTYAITFDQCFHTKDLEFLAYTADHSDCEKTS